MTLPDRNATRDWIGRTVVDRDGAEIGACAALLADEATGLPEWMYVERDGETVVVPLRDATENGGRVQVTVTRADVEGAPRFGPTRELSLDQEAALYRHYRIEYSTATSDSLLPAPEAEPAGSEPTEAEPTRSAPIESEPTGSAPDGTAGQPVATGAPRRGRGPAAALAVLAGLAAAVVAGVRLRRGPTLGLSLGLPRLLRRAAPPPQPAARRALAAARTRAVQVAAAAGPVANASGDLARRAASAGARSARLVAADAAQRGRAASTAARTYTDVATARLVPLLATSGQAAWRAARAGTESALRATDAAALAIAAAVPRVAAGAVRAGTTGLRAVLTVGAAAEAVPEVVAETGERLEKGWRKVMGRLSLGLGFGVGYVLGARAGRARYEEIKQAAAGFMERPEVQQALETARNAAPAPLRGSIDKLSGRGSGRHSAGGGTVDVDAVVVEEVDVVVTPSAPVSGTGGPVGTDAPLRDPLIPPTKSSGGDPTGRP